MISFSSLLQGLSIISVVILFSKQSLQIPAESSIIISILFSKHFRVFPFLSFLYEFVNTNLSYGIFLSANHSFVILYGSAYSPLSLPVIITIVCPSSFSFSIYSFAPSITSKFLIILSIFFK